MRLVVALVMTCAAVAAMVLRDRGETVPASEQVVAVDRPVCAPPVLRGTAPRVESTAVDVDHSTDSGSERMADPVEDIRARSWTIEVVDAAGGEVAPHGLIAVYFEPEGNLP